jgi:exopolysaccharide production protein ExoQ
VYRGNIAHLRIPHPTKIFVVLVLLLSTGAYFPALFGQASEGVAAEDTPVTRLVWLGIYLTTGLLIALRWKRFVRVATRDRFLLLLVGIALLSVLWSAAPEATVRRSAALLGTTLFGAYLATRYDLQRLLSLLTWALGIAGLLSLVSALVLTSYGVVSYEGWWEGVYGEKNATGAAMALGALVFLLRALSQPRHRWLTWAFFGLSVGLLLLSNALTALMSLLILFLLFPFYKVLRWQYTLMLPFLILAVLVGGVASGWLLGNMENILPALGRDVTLTGRTEIWPAVIDSIRQRPWLGYGYGGFWLGWEGESAHVWSRTLVLFWPQLIGPTHAHNAVLEAWLDLG